VERSVQQLRQRYREDISFKEMAEAAGVSRWQFGEKFKQLTGQSPMAYLTELRISYAKRLMSDSAATVKEIANQAGFRDEYYFSRRFKQTTGMTPTQYRLGRQPRIFSIQYVGELLALGIQPIGTNRAMLEVFKDLAGAAFEEPIDAEELSALKPDLIIFPTFTPERQVEPLRRIAPTIGFDWQADVYSRLRAIGERLGRGKEADEWIARYEAKAARMRSRLHPYIKPGMTASAFVYHAHGLYVYAGHHFGHTLYHGLGFEPPAAIKRLMDGNSQLKWKKISVEMLSDYAGDIVFMALASSGDDAIEGRMLLQHPVWKSLAAVQNGRGYVVDAVWGNYNPVTLECHLDDLAARLEQNG
jgi:ABC-type Fe3+-hydroxamate transport system substrate-binding protein